MSLKIYTYSNPFELENESYWNSIKNYPHFCVSQTLVNGLKNQKVSPFLSKTKNICTIKGFVNALYSDWDSIGTKIRQMVEIDNAISSLDIVDGRVDSIKKSLLNNTKSISNSIRILSALNLNPYDFSTENLNIDQKLLVEIYKKVFDNNFSFFKFKKCKDESIIDKAIEKALIEANKNEKDLDFSKIDNKAVVINGIHQFTPDIICAIEDLLQFKDVILIFNYQKQYSVVYETWMRIYSVFNQPIKFSDVDEFIPNPFLPSNETNVFADSIGKLINCEYSEFNTELNSIEVIEFENITEFANYAAALFDEALEKKKKSPLNTKTPLYYMEEQMYSASGKVNDILRAYFPNQFGERHFLDYPIGHFFVATMNMWDSENNSVIVNNFSDIKECINAGILKESKHGLLINSFNIVLPYIEDLNNIDEIISKLSKLHKYLSIPSKEKEKLGYFNIKETDLLELINALKDLKNIIISFFEDFKNGNDNFRRFYDKVKRFIQTKVDDTSDFDKEMITVMKQLLERMDKSDIPNEGSFITLKQTMSYYLSQDEYINSGARWIVRGFEQIDGDILKSIDDSKKYIYHFCCLSDKDICASKDERLPWPLDVSFFEYIQIPLDWKYQLFLKSKTEYHNFNRYALLYGLEFARCKCKFSYVKSENNKENDLYHILSMLGVKIKKYNSYDNSGFSNRLVYPSDNNVNVDNYAKSIEKINRYKLSICSYKYGAETIIQNHTIYRDRFLIHNYMRILIRNSALEDLQGLSFDSKNVQKKIGENFEKLQNKFRIASQLEKAQLLAQIYKENAVCKKSVPKNVQYAIEKALVYFKLINEEQVTDL